MAAGVMLAALLAGGTYIATSNSTPLPSGLAETTPALPHSDAAALPVGIDAAEYRQAELAYYGMHRTQPTRSDVLMTIGALAERDQRLSAAAAAYLAVPDADIRYGESALLRSGVVLVGLDRGVEAESRLAQFLQRDSSSQKTSEPLSHEARDWLRYIYSVELRFEDRQRVLREIHSQGAAGISDSKEYIFPSLLLWNSDRGRDRLRRFLKQSPGELKLNIAQGRYLTGEGRIDAALELLEPWHRQRPQDRDVRAALLEAHYERGDWEAFATLLPVDETADDPWLLLMMRGEYALHRQDWSGAVRSFEQLQQADPTNTVATMGLSRAFARLGQNDEANRMQHRSRILARIRPRLTAVTEQDADASEEIAAACREMGLTEGAEIFSQHAHRIRTRRTAPNSDPSIAEPTEGSP